MSQRVKRAPSLTPEQKAARKRRALMKFRAIVRFVIANLYWMTEADELRIGENIVMNLQMITRKKIRKSNLTIKERAILRKPKEERTEEEKQLLNKVIGGLKCFRRYPPKVKSQLAAVTYFVYIGPGRPIVKQDHDPQAMYFVLSGEASVTVRHFDNLLNEWVEEESGTIGTGTMFGEVALIHGIVRLATITTITPVELLMIKKEDFDLVLKDTVLKAWEEIQKIMNQFTYFKNWDVVTRRECAILSRTKSFLPDETVIGDDVGLANYVFFITKGACCIIEHLILKVHEFKGKKRYELLQFDKHSGVQDLPEDPRISYIINKYLGPDKPHETVSAAQVSSKSTMSTAGTPQFPQTDSKSMNQSKKETVSVETHFVKVCDLYEGACFNIGEKSVNRRVVANVPTSCLLVPRYWILKNNKDNIWSRVQQFLNKHIPSTQEIFKQFLAQRKFLKYRKSLIKDLLAEKRVANDNTVHNIPYSIRLKELMEDYFNE